MCTRMVYCNISPGMATKIKVGQTLESKTIIGVLIQQMRLEGAVANYFMFLAKYTTHYKSSPSIHKLYRLTTVENAPKTLQV